MTPRPIKTLLGFQASPHSRSTYSRQNKTSIDCNTMHSAGTFGGFSEPQTMSRSLEVG